MLSFSMLPYAARLLVVIPALSCLLLYSALFVLMIEDRKSPLNYSMAALMMVLSMAEIGVLRSCFLHMNGGGLLTAVQQLPWIIHVLVVLTLFGFALFGLIREGRYRSTHFVRSTIKEAIDTMPAGLCFADMNGHPMLVNRRMYEFAEQLTGSSLINVQDFLQEIAENTQLRNNKRIDLYDSRDKDIYTFEMADGLVMQLTREIISISDRSFVQLAVTDITVLHSLYCNVSDTNRALLAQRQEMRSLADRLIQSNHEEELLNYKIRVHNDVGQLLLANGQVLGGDSGLKECRESAGDWIRLVERFSNLEDDKQQKDSELLQEIVSVAEQIGCRVIFTRPLPEHLVERSIVRQAIREAILNAVRHGGANEVTVDCSISDGCAKLLISNNGKAPAKGFSMRGGLKNLYDSIRGEGGDFLAEIGERFTLKISLPYEET